MNSTPASTSRPTSSALVARQLDRRGERRLRPAELPGEHLADLVGVAVDRLLAHDHQVGLLLLDDRLQHVHHDERVELASFGVDADGAVGAHRERRADLLRGVLRTDGDDDDLAAAARVGLAVLEEAQRGLDRVLVERVDHPGRAGQVDVAVLDLRLLLRVGDPLDGNEDLHGDSFFRDLE